MCEYHSTNMNQISSHKFSENRHHFQLSCIFLLLFFLYTYRIEIRGLMSGWSSDASNGKIVLDADFSGSVLIVQINDKVRTRVVILKLACNELKWMRNLPVIVNKAKVGKIIAGTEQDTVEKKKRERVITTALCISMKVLSFLLSQYCGQI